MGEHRARHSSLDVGRLTFHGPHFTFSVAHERGGVMPAGGPPDCSLTGAEAEKRIGGHGYGVIRSGRRWVMDARRTWAAAVGSLALLVGGPGARADLRYDEVVRVAGTKVVRE